MEFDSIRYVAPGVPKLSKEFVEGQLDTLVREKRLNLEGLKENPLILECILGLRAREVLRKSKDLESCSLDAVVQAGKEEMLVSASLVQPVLVYPVLRAYTQGREFEKAESGLPYFSDRDKIGFSKAFFAAEPSPKRVISMQEATDGLLLRTIKELQRNLFSKEVLSADNIGILAYCLEKGSQLAYGLLRKQQEINELKDQFKI